MVDKRRLRLLMIIRSLALWAVGLRYGFTLLRVGVANAAVLIWYQRDKRMHGHYRILADVWLEGQRYKKLFRAFPDLALSQDAKKRKELMNTLRKVRDICSHHKLEADPLTAPSAIEIQAAAIRYAFLRLFKLRLTPVESEKLGKYGSVSLATKEFLEYCGYGSRALIEAPLSLQLPMFVAWSELRHEKIDARRNFLLIFANIANLEKEGGWTGRIKSLWFGAKLIVFRTSWSWEDTRERMKCKAHHNKEQEEAYREVTEVMKRFAVASQAEILCMLAREMFLRAVEVLLDMHDESLRRSDNCILRGLPTQDRTLLSVIRELENNLKSILPNYF